MEYATSLFERATIERYLGYFRTLLRAMVADDSPEGGSVAHTAGIGAEAVSL